MARFGRAFPAPRRTYRRVTGPAAIGKSLDARWNVRKIVLGFLDLDGASGSYASTPDHTSLDITGDIDIRIIDAAADTWAAAAKQVLAAKWQDILDDQRSWVLAVTTTGALELTWDIDGTGASFKFATSSATLGSVGAVNGQPISVRATLDVDVGGTQYQVTFYYSFDSGTTWTQLGSSSPTGTPTSIYSGTSPLYVGARSANGSVSRFAGAIRKVEIRSGIGGTVVANPDFGEQYQGTTTFTDAAGRGWTVNGAGAFIESTAPRMA